MAGLLDISNWTLDPSLRARVAPFTFAQMPSLLGGGGNANALAQTSAAPMAQPPAGKFDWSANSNLWPMLMGLASGIAGGQGWGPGLSQGFSNASVLAQQKRENDIREQAYALQLAELKNTMDYQNRSLGISDRNAATSERSQAAIDEDRARKNLLDQKKLGGYVSIINAEAPRFIEAAKNATSGWLPGDTSSFQRLAVAAAGINGDNPKEISDLYVPQVGEKSETRANKIKAFAGYLNSLPGTYSEAYPSLPWWKSDAFATPSDSMNVQGGGGAPVEAGAAAKGGWQSNPSARKADTQYTLPNGQKAIWRVFPNGVQGWEPIE